MNANARDALRIVLAALQSAEKPCREARTCSQFRHAFHPGDRGDRHDPRHDRDIDADKFTTIAEIQEIAVIEEKLGHNVVRSSVYLLFQIFHLEQSVGSRWVPFRESCHTNSKSATVRMVTRFVKLSNEFDQIDRMLEVIVCLAILVAFWGIAAKREDIADACLRVTFENSGDLRFVVTHAREMGDRIERGRALDTHDEIMGQLPCRTTRPVSDADEMRLIGFQLPNGSIKTFHRFGTLWREKLK